MRITFLIAMLIVNVSVYAGKNDDQEAVDQDFKQAAQDKKVAKDPAATPEHAVATGLRETTSK